MTGQIGHRGDASRPLAYAVIDCETTGTRAAVHEIVSVAALRLDSDGKETVRFVRLVRPLCPIPADATAIHGITDAHVHAAPSFAEIADELLAVLEGAVFVAHNAPFDLAMLRAAFRRSGTDYEPAQVACTLDAYRLLEPSAADHRLESLCARHAVELQDAHDALSDVLATAVLLRKLLDRDLAPETARLDLPTYLRMRSRGDTRPASAAQIRRVFALAHQAGVPHGQLRDLVARAAQADDVDTLTREQVQDVFDVLEFRVSGRTRRAA